MRYKLSIQNIAVNLLSLNNLHTNISIPYGKVLREYVGTEKERYLTTQHERDEETGLDYRGARYYDCDVARFLSLDPHAMKYPDLSAYCYVAGNPIALIDPDGRDHQFPNEFFHSERVTHKVKINIDGTSVHTFINKKEWSNTTTDKNGVTTVKTTYQYTTTSYNVSAEKGMEHAYTSMWEMTRTKKYQSNNFNEPVMPTSARLISSTHTAPKTTSLKETDMDEDTKGYVMGLAEVVSQTGAGKNPYSVPLLPSLESNGAGLADAGAGVLEGIYNKTLPYFVTAWSAGKLIGKAIRENFPADEKTYNVETWYKPR